MEGSSALPVRPCVKQDFPRPERPVNTASPYQGLPGGQLVWILNKFSTILIFYINIELCFPTKYSIENHFQCI